MSDNFSASYPGSGSGGGIASNVSVSNFPNVQAVIGPLTEDELRSAPVEVIGSLANSPGFSTISVSTRISVTSSTTMLLASNLNRVYTHIVNNTNNIVYLQYGAAAVVGEGIKLTPGAMLSLSAGELYLGQINAISNTTSLIDVLEGE